jgi:hypothetical protein
MALEVIETVLGTRHMPGSWEAFTIFCGSNGFTKLYFLCYSHKFGMIGMASILIVNC